MLLKSVVSQRLLEDVINDKERTNKINRETVWRVLVLDEKTQQILSSSTKMHQLDGIALVEPMFKTTEDGKMVARNREPIQNFEAIYFICPTEQAVDALISDFEEPNNFRNSENLYKSAHIYFTTACPDNLFNKMANSNVKNYLKTLKEINLSYFPIDSQVFSLNRKSSNKSFFLSAQWNKGKLDEMAEELASVCSSLDEYPSISYQGGARENRNKDFASLVQKHLDNYKKVQPTFGTENSAKAKSKLIILDRGFDTISTVLHELTYQALVYDLCQDPIDSQNVYTYQREGKTKQAFLDASNELWTELKYEHWARVNQIMTKRIEDIKKKQESLSDDLKEKFRRAHEIDKRKAEWDANISLMELVTKNHKKFDFGEDDSSIKGGALGLKLQNLEQNLATGLKVSEEGNLEKYDPDMEDILGALLDENIGSDDTSLSEEDKLRLLLLFSQTEKGASVDMKNLCNTASLDDEKTVPLIESLGRVYGNKGWGYTQERNMSRKYDYAVSRWTPVLKDICEDAINEKLLLEHFPTVQGNSLGGAGPSQRVVSGARAPRRGPNSHTTDKPRLIVFIIGGATYSECRVAHEVATSSEWDVIVGGTHILTPRQFIEDLGEFASETTGKAVKDFFSERLKY